MIAVMGSGSRGKTSSAKTAVAIRRSSVPDHDEAQELLEAHDLGEREPFVLVVPGRAAI